MSTADLESDQISLAASSLMPRSTSRSRNQTRSRAASIAPKYSASALLSDTDFCVFSHLVNGYAGAPDSARMVNTFHGALLALRMRWYGEWVPSKANIADILTRLEHYHELITHVCR